MKNEWEEAWDQLHKWKFMNLHSVSRFMPVLRPETCQPQERRGLQEEGPETAQHVFRSVLLSSSKGSVVIHSSRQTQGQEPELGSRVAWYVGTRGKWVTVVRQPPLKNNPKHGNEGLSCQRADLQATHLCFYFEWKEKLPKGTVSWAVVKDIACWSLKYCLNYSY